MIHFKYTLIVAVALVVTFSAANVQIDSKIKSGISSINNKIKQAHSITKNADVEKIKSVVESRTKTQWNGPACILGGAIAHLVFGTMYCW